MTEKEIIIDGVNVAECRHYEDVCFYNCNETRTIDGGIVCVKCEETPNCYYKQLKRKEEECEKRQNEWQEAVEEKLVVQSQNDQLEIKNINLNEQLDQLKANCETYKYQWEKQYELCEYWHDQAEKYKQALQEIKGIAENTEEQCAIPENYFKRNNVSWKQHQLKGLTCKFKQILQKCEVLDADIQIKE